MPGAARQRARSDKPCCGRSSDSRSASPRRDRCGRSSRPRSARRPISRSSWPRPTRSCAPPACRGRSRAISEASPSWSFPASSTSKHLPEDDEEAIALLTKIKGIGRWSAEIYLLFAEGRGRRFPRRRPGGHDRDRTADGPCRQAEREAAARDWRNAGGPIAAPPRCSHGTVTIVRCCRRCNDPSRRIR